jgi:hypothetical protein
MYDEEDMPSILKGGEDEHLFEALTEDAPMDKEALQENYTPFGKQVKPMVSLPDEEFTDVSKAMLDYSVKMTKDMESTFNMSRGRRFARGGGRAATSKHNKYRSPTHKEALTFEGTRYMSTSPTRLKAEAEEQAKHRRRRDSELSEEMSCSSDEEDGEHVGQLAGGSGGGRAHTRTRQMFKQLMQDAKRKFASEEYQDAIGMLIEALSFRGLDVIRSSLDREAMHLLAKAFIALGDYTAAAVVYSDGMASQMGDWEDIREALQAELGPDVSSWKHPVDPPSLDHVERARAQPLSSFLGEALLVQAAHRMPKKGDMIRLFRVEHGRSGDEDHEEVEGGATEGGLKHNSGPRRASIMQTYTGGGAVDLSASMMTVTGQTDPVAASTATSGASNIRLQLVGCCYVPHEETRATVCNPSLSDASGHKEYRRTRVIRKAQSPSGRGRRNSRSSRSARPASPQNRAGVEASKWAAKFRHPQSFFPLATNMDGAGEYVLCVGGSFFRRYDIEFGFNPDFEPHLYTYGSDEGFYEREHGASTVSGASQGHDEHKRNAHMVPLRSFQVEAPTVNLTVNRHLGSRKLVAGRGPIEVEYTHSASDGHPADDTVGMFEVATGLRLEEQLVPAASSGSLRFKAATHRNSLVMFRYLTKQRETRTSADPEIRRRACRRKGSKRRMNRYGEEDDDDDRQIFSFLDKLDVQDGGCFFSSEQAPPAKRAAQLLGPSGCFWLSEFELTQGELKCGHVVAGASEEVQIEPYGGAMDRIAGITASRECNVCMISTDDDLATAVKRRVMSSTILPLRQFCEARHVAFSFTDLNNVMNDASLSIGDRLRLALDEIDRCSPFVVVVMGDDYGAQLPLKTKRAGPEHRHKHSSVLYDPLKLCPLELLRGCSAGGGVCSKSNAPPRAGPGLGAPVGATGVGAKYPWLISWQNASLRSASSDGGAGGDGGGDGGTWRRYDSAGEDCLGASFFELVLAHALLLQTDTTARQRCTVLVGTAAERARVERMGEDEKTGGGLPREKQRQNTDKIKRMKAQLRHEPDPTPTEIAMKRRTDAMDELRASISAVGGSVSVFDESHTFWEELVAEEASSKKSSTSGPGDSFSTSDFGSASGSLASKAGTMGSTNAVGAPKRHRHDPRKDASAIVSSRLRQQISSTWATTKPSEYELNCQAVEAWKETMTTRSYVPDEKMEMMLTGFVDTVRTRAVDAAAAQWKIEHAQNTLAGGGFGWDADAAVKGGEGDIKLAGAVKKEASKADLAKLARIDEDLISSGGKAIMIEGAEGAGKSAFVSHWSQHALPPSYARCMDTGKYVEEICEPVVCYDCLVEQAGRDEEEPNFFARKAKLHKAVHCVEGAEGGMHSSMPVVTVLALIGTVPSISSELTLLSYLISAITPYIVLLETRVRKRREKERAAVGLSKHSSAKMIHRLTVARKQLDPEEATVSGKDKGKATTKPKAKGAPNVGKSNGGKAEGGDNADPPPKAKAKVNKLGMPVKQQVSDQRERLWEIVARLSKLATVVLVLDGLDKLRSSDPNIGKPDPATGKYPEVEWWLPELKKIPHNVFVVGTCTEGARHAEEAEKKGEWPRAMLDGLSPEKINQICWRTLHQEAQTLDETMVEKLCASELCANPFNLTLMLEEARTCTFANQAREAPESPSDDEATMAGAEAALAAGVRDNTAIAAVLNPLLRCETQHGLMTAVAEHWTQAWPGLRDLLSYVQLSRDMLDVELSALMAEDSADAGLDDSQKSGVYNPTNPNTAGASSLLASTTSFMPPSMAVSTTPYRCCYQLLREVLRRQLVSVHGHMYLSTDRWETIILDLWLPQDPVVEGAPAKKMTRGGGKDEGAGGSPQPLVPLSHQAPMRKMLAYYRCLPSYTRRHCELPFYLLQLGLKGECRRVLTTVEHFSTYCFSSSVASTSFSSTNWPLFVWYVEQLQWPKEAVVTALVVQFRGYFKLQVQASLDELFEFKFGDTELAEGYVWKEEHLMVFDRIVKGAKLLSKGNDAKLERKVNLSRKKLKAKVATVLAMLEKINKHKAQVAQMHEAARLARQSTKLLSEKQLRQSEWEGGDDSGADSTTRFPMI